MAVEVPEERVMVSTTTRRDPDEDICSRTSWVDATAAISHISKGRARGNRTALWLRKFLQDQLYQLGEFCEVHSGKVVFVAFLVAATFCVALKSAVFVTDIGKLWVEEGGRLEKELDYVSSVIGDGSGTRNQILIQLPKEASANVLTAEALLTHLQGLSVASEVTVEMFDTSWKLNDLCFATSFPYFQNHLIDQIFERLTPCSIITPLDCFWEGSKLLGPEFPITIPGYGERVKWTNLDPSKILNKIAQLSESSGGFFSYASFSDFMKRSGISSAYQRKPCLNPQDPDCPQTAPNKKSFEEPDIGAELTGGCYGFAGKFLHWPEELVIGAAKKNRTGHVVRGEALQSIVQLMGPKDLYDHWRDHYKVHNIDWTQRNAQLIIDSWVEKFSQQLRRLADDHKAETTGRFHLLSFSSTTLPRLIASLSNVPVSMIVFSCLITGLYVCVVYFRSTRSSSGLALAGIILVISSTAAGLGLCTLIGLPMTAATTQVLPFLALGMGIQPIFFILSVVEDMSLTEADSKENSKVSRVGQILKRCGISVVLTSLCKAAAFLAAVLIPVFIVKTFCLQATIIVIINVLATLLVFPALISLDLRRRDAEKADILCCFPRTIFYKESNLSDTSSPSPWPFQYDDQNIPSTKNSIKDSLSATRIELYNLENCRNEWNELKTAKGLKATAYGKDLEKGDLEVQAKERSLIALWRRHSLLRWLKISWSEMLSRGGMKTIVLLSFVASVGAGIWGISVLEDGLDLTDVVPRGSPEFKFLNAQQKYFGFYHMFAVTRDNFEYPMKQQLLHEYHESFSRIPSIIKNDNGGLPDSWLSLFRDWLVGLQRAFDNDWDRGLVTENGWNANTSDKSVLAYKLLVQTGHVDHPVDKSLLSQVRLVNSEGIINPRAFYNYLTAWYSNDVLAYTASQADLRPTPRIWYHERADTDLRIPKSSRLIYAHLPFLINQLPDTAAVIEVVQNVREICRKFEEKGLPNFPLGVPFTYWEQYIHLRFFLILSLGAVAATVFSVVAVISMSAWASSLVLVIMVTLVLQIAGLLGMLGLKLSAVPALLIVLSVGMTAELAIHVILAFLTFVGDRSARSRLAVVSVIGVAVSGTIFTLVAISPLFFSDLYFIRRYFFLSIASILGLSLFDGLVVLPVLLSILGPPAFLIPRGSCLRLPPPSPPPPSLLSPHQQPFSSPSMRNEERREGDSRGRTASVRKEARLPSRQTPTTTSLFDGSSSHMTPRRQYQTVTAGPHTGSNLSLTTITEEETTSASNSSGSPRPSHEVLVEPKVVVETTTFESPSDDRSGARADRSNHITTTVTAKVKVEVHNKGGTSGCGKTSNEVVSRGSASDSTMSSSSEDSDSGGSVSLSKS